MSQGPVAPAACRLCGGVTEVQFQARLLARNDVSYYRCIQCQLVQSEPPYWLEHAYSRSVSSLDTGLVQRNLYVAQVLSVLLTSLGMRRKAVLDYAGGCGLLVRLMRDRGFNFHWQDLYTPNLLARGFEQQADVRYAAVTAIEVLEHLVDVAHFFETTLRQMQPEYVIATTHLRPDDLGADWPYLMAETGQHIALFHSETFRWIARAYGYHYTGARYFHVLSKRPISRLLLAGCVWLGYRPYPVLRRFNAILRDQDTVRRTVRDS